jgi:hypothetical protein
MRVVTQAQPGFIGISMHMRCCTEYGTPPTQDIAQYAVLYLSAGSLVVPWLGAWQPWSDPTQRPSLLLGSAASQLMGRGTYVSTYVLTEVICAEKAQGYALGTRINPQH